MATKAAAKAKKAVTGPYWIGFDLGGTKMMACVLDEKYNILGTARKSTGGAAGAAKGVKRIISTVREAMEDAGVDPSKCQGFGIGCPGTVDTEKGILITAPNLGWHRTQLGNALKKEFKCPVAVLNDVDAGTYAEYHLGSAKARARCSVSSPARVWALGSSMMANFSMVAMSPPWNSATSGCPART